MSTKQECLRKNITEIAQTMECAGLTMQKCTVAALGNDVFKVKFGTFEKTIEGEDCFSEKAMYQLVESFIEHFSEISPGAVDNGYGRDTHTQLVGNDTRSVSEDDIVSVDTRMDCFNDHALEDFWQFGGIECLQAEIEALLDNHPLSCYHYKGKRFEVAPNIVSIEVSTYYLDEDDRELMECYEGEWDIKAVVSEEAKAAAEQVRQLIVDSKKSLEEKSLTYAMVEKIRALADFFEDDLEAKQGEFYDELPSYIATEYKGRSYGPDGEDVFMFLQSKHSELKVVGQAKMTKFANKLGFNWSFDFNDRNEGSIQFTNRENSRDHYHVSAEEFLANGKDWKLVFRDVIQPMVQLRAMQEIDYIIKTKLQGRLKDVAEHVWVTFSDSIKAGNCEFGSRQFVERNHINLEELGAIRGDALLEMEDSDFTRRIILMKAANDANVRKIVGL